MSARETSPAYRAVLAGAGSLLVLLAGYLALALRAVPTRDLWVVLLASLYGLGFSRTVASPPLPGDPAPKSASGAGAAAAPRAQCAAPVPPLAGRGPLRVQAFVLLVLSAALSLGAPAAWLLFFSPTGAQAALLAPHLFVMATQVLFELLAYRPSMSVLVRLAVPVFTTTYRMRLLAAWVEGAQAVVALAGDDVKDEDLAMRALAVTNLVFWAGVLFYFLLLRVVPRFFAVVPPDVAVRLAFEKERMSSLPADDDFGPVTLTASTSRTTAF